MDVTTMLGVRCRRVSRLIGVVGLYVLGGIVVLLSMVFMFVVLVKIVGCECVVFVMSSRKDGFIVSEVLYVAKKAGVMYIFKVGGV